MMISTPVEGELDRRFTLPSHIAVLFFFSLGVSVFIFAFPLFAFRHNYSGAWLGGLSFVYFAARIFVAPAAGITADHYNSKCLLLGAAYLGVFLCCSYFLLPRQIALFAIQFGLGLGSGVIKPLILARLAADISGDTTKQGRAFGWSGSAANLAFFLGPVLGGLLYYHSNMKLVVCFVGGCMLLVVSIIHLFFADISTSDTEKEQSHCISSKKSSFFMTASFRLPLILAIFGRTFGIATLLVFFPIFLSQKLGLPSWLTGVLIAIPGGVSCFLLPITGKIIDRFETNLHRDLFVLGGMVISAISLIATSICASFSGQVVIGVFMGIGTALSLPSSLLQVAENQKGKGRAMGMFQMIASSGFLAGPLVSGILVQWSTSAATGIMVAGMVGLCSVFPLFFMIGKVQSIFFLVSLFCIPSFLLSSYSEIYFPSQHVIRREGEDSKKKEKPAPQTAIKTFANLAMGGIVHLKMVGTDSETAKKAANSAFQIIAQREIDFSHRSPTGSIGRVNLAAGTKPETVSPEAFSLISRALDLSNKSDGVFDISIGAITTLPFYYREKASQDKANLVDYKKVILNSATHTVFLPVQGMALDLGGLAKGSIVDAAAVEIQKSGVPAALIEASGDFYCYGNRTWRVGVQDPRSDGLLGVIEVQNAGVCGSGDYYQYDAGTDENGERKHHIIDPARLDSAHRSIAVTVIAPTTELADALATTLFIMGYKEGREFLKKFQGCSALWVLPNRRIVMSENFPPFISH